jgi:4-hydroxybenzoate polyprenyltransferase
MSLFYVAGMFLNDAFDREFDARSTPIARSLAGQITARACSRPAMECWARRCCC